MPLVEEMLSIGDDLYFRRETDSDFVFDPSVPCVYDWYALIQQRLEDRWAQVLDVVGPLK